MREYCQSAVGPRNGAAARDRRPGRDWRHQGKIDLAVFDRKPFARLAGWPCRVRSRLGFLQAIAEARTDDSFVSSACLSDRLSGLFLFDGRVGARQLVVW